MSLKFENDNQVQFTTKKLLEKEINQLSNLKEIVERSKQVSKNVSSILDSFDHRLGKLEQTILPLYQQTGDLQRRQKNTEKVLQSLDYVIGYYSVSGEVENIIRERPSSVGIQEYIKAMDKLRNAAKFFQTNNPQASELENIKSLFEKGCQQLSIEFRDELKKYQKGYPTSFILDLIDFDGNLKEEISRLISEDNKELLAIEFCPNSRVREDLKQIATWLDKHGTSDRLTVYAKQRAFVVSETLKQLKTHQKSSSGERPTAHLLSPSQANSNSPGLNRSKGVRLDLSRLKTSKISQKATRAIMRAIPTSNSRRQLNASATDCDLFDDDQVTVFLTQISALYSVGVCEFILVCLLVPEDKILRTFELIIKDSINEMTVEAECLSTQAHKSVSRGDIQGVNWLLTLLRHMTLMTSRFDSLLANCQPALRDQFTAVLQSLRDTTGNALVAFVEGLRNESERALPKDGTVHELTSNTLVFAEQLLDFTKILAPILRKTFGNDSSLAGFLTSNNPKIYLGLYIKKVLANLGHALVHRSSSYSDPHLCSIFMLNNYNYILRTLLDTDLLSVVKLVEPACDRLYSSLILEQKESYCECLKKMLEHLDLSDEPVLYSVHADKIKDKEKQSIKDRFSGFNKELHELQQTQRGYSIPDLALRESIRRDNKERILPKYQAFHDRFCCISFSKNINKYIKYTPVEVSQKLNEFFDVAA